MGRVMCIVFVCSLLLRQSVKFLPPPSSTKLRKEGFLNYPSSVQYVASMALPDNEGHINFEALALKNNQNSCYVFNLLKDFIIGILSEKKRIVCAYFFR